MVVALNTARDVDVYRMRTVAIRLFAGRRTAETNRLTPENLHSGFVEVTAAKSKTRQRRLVKIEPCLAAWLDLGGELPLRNPDQKFAALTAALPFEWPRNAARHSFVSYHLAHFQNAAQTALAAGHSEAMLFGHYRAVVTPDQARDYWTVLPQG